MKTIRFVFNKDENETLIYQKDVEQNRISIIGERFDKSEISQQWQNRVGKYKAVNNLEGDFNSFDNFELVIENNVLHIKTTVMIGGKENIQMGVGILSDNLAYV
jgi:hypothetical protein